MSQLCRPSLDRVDFFSMELTLKPNSPGKQVRINVSKKPKTGLPYYDINYQIQAGTTGKKIDYDLDRLAEERNYRGLPSRLMRERLLRDGGFADLNKELAQTAQICLLSVNRFNADTKTDPRLAVDRGLLSAVDQKLEAITNQLVRLFSKLDRESADAAAVFQRESFVSLLSIETQKLFTSAVQKLDITRESDSLARALLEIGVKKEKSEEVISKLFGPFEDARKKILNHEGVSIQGIMVLAAALRAKETLHKSLVCVNGVSPA